METVLMWHPDVPHTRDHPVRVSRRSFDITWSKHEPEPWQEWTEAVQTPPEKPPKTGAGSGRQAWAEYAASLGLDVPSDMSKAELIEKVEEKKGNS